MEEEGQQENIIMIRGFPVSFPKGRKPFAPQLALMSKLLMGVQRRENCLLESPTGTGKTLALLSAALAWQRQQKEQGLATESECQVEEDEAHTVHTGPHEPLQSFDDFRYEPTGEAPVELAYEDDHVVPSKDTPPLEKKANRASFYGDDDDDDDDVFETPKKKRQKSRKTRACSPDVHGIGERGSKGSAADADADAATASADSSASHGLAGAERDSDEEQMDSPGSHALGGTDASPGARSKPSAKTAPPRTKPSKQGKAAAAPKAAPKTPKTRGRVPRVYFCSRTHSQLNQVVAELRTCRAAFRDTSAVGIGEDGKPFSMALLASRKSTCINKEACSDPKGVDDACKRLLKDKACSYYRRAKWGQTRLPPVWDVEEAVVLGRKNQACPYYTARDSMTTADLVLCPYNYLVDPGVRGIMGINLKDAVVIFDEAHNLEDSAREAASAKLSLRALSNAAGEMFRLGTKSSSLAPSYDLLRGVIIGVQAFLEEEDMGLNLGSYEKAHKVFKGTEALGLMQSRAGVTVETLISLKEALKLVVNENANDDPSSADQDEDVGSGGGRGGDVLSSGAVHVTASLVKVLGFLLAEGMENVDHYKMVVLRERGPWEPAASRGRRGRNRGGASSIATMETYLCFWCQSASVCFSEIDKQVHSVILTSGTLSPLDSFAGELGIDFPHRLEAPHVINVRKQCLVTSIGYFGGVSLDARYTNQHDLKFQDALGNALLQHARVVPGGILVFFPSYGLMDKMHERWAVTGLLQALDAIKGVHLEPRGQGKIESVLAEYYGDIKAARELGENRPPSNSRTGALMLAVARGKVSEGIDFSDDACRMCVVIGIPYPSSKDLQVVLKKEYQDQRKRRNPRLVGGRAWYNLQAFRAVNQAVGRCIRHRSDYGAIVLCDPRYGSSAETTASLSKWVRSSVKQCRNVENSLPQVASFFRSQQQNDEHPVPLAPVTDCCLSGAGAQAEGPGREATPDIAVQESPEPELVQQSLSQMFRRSSAECAVTPTENVASGRAASVIQGTNGRTALQLLSQGSAERTTTRRDSESPKAKELAERPDAAPRQPAGSLWCRPGGVLLSQPATGSPGDLSRRVLVRGSCHLFRASATPSSHMEQSSDSDPRHNTTTLFQVSRGWAPGEGLSEGEGRWVATDGLVYAPLFCSCSGCGSAPVGEKAVGAGLLGRDLIGRAWFFPARVQADRDGVVDETSPRELVLPAYVATRQNSHRQDRRG